MAASDLSLFLSSLFLTVFLMPFFSTILYILFVDINKSPSQKKYIYIISEIKDAKYVRIIMLDSTPDSAHGDQVSEIVRYINNTEDDIVEIKLVFR